MHNIPTIILAAFVAASWKREVIGAVTFISAGLLYIGLLVISALRGSFAWYMVSWAVIISGPAFFTGILFWLEHKRSRDS